MITKDGAAKVMDFGIAHQSRGTADATMTVASGTPQYMAPEQALGSVSKASDVYALGVIAYEMLTLARGRSRARIFSSRSSGKNSSCLQNETPACTAGTPGSAFFASTFEPDPTKRPADANAFLRGFDESLRLLLQA